MSPHDLERPLAVLESRAAGAEPAPLDPLVVEMIEEFAAVTCEAMTAEPFAYAVRALDWHAARKAEAVR